MAKFTVQGGFGLPLNGERAHFGCEQRDPFRSRVCGGSRFLEKGPSGFHRGSRIWSPGHWRAWSMGRKPHGSKAEECVNGCGDGGDEEEEDDAEFVKDELSCFRGLVLDISYRPVNVVCWRRAICLEFMEKADVLEYYDQTVSSPRGSFYIPAVLRVTACARCNSKKGQKTPEEANIRLIKIPKAPKDFDILAIPLTSSAVKMLKTRKGVPEEWLQYLSKPTP